VANGLCERPLNQAGGSGVAPLHGNTIGGGVELTLVMKYSRLNEVELEYL
jgi:hypothetical protein